MLEMLSPFLPYLAGGGALAFVWYIILWWKGRNDPNIHEHDQELDDMDKERKKDEAVLAEITSKTPEEDAKDEALKSEAADIDTEISAKKEELKTRNEKIDNMTSDEVEKATEEAGIEVKDF